MAYAVECAVAAKVGMQESEALGHIQLCMAFLGFRVHVAHSEIGLVKAWPSGLGNGHAQFRLGAVGRSLPMRQPGAAVVLLFCSLTP